MQRNEDIAADEPAPDKQVVFTGNGDWAEANPGFPAKQGTCRNQEKKREEVETVGDVQPLWLFETADLSGGYAHQVLPTEVLHQSESEIGAPSGLGVDIDPLHQECRRDLVPDRFGCKRPLVPDSDFPAY